MSAGRARRIAAPGDARRAFDADGRRRVHLLLPEAEREEQLRQRPLGGNLDDVGQVAALDPRCAGGRVEVARSSGDSPGRERVVAEPDPGVLSA